jgi:hypothetical protein
MIARVACALCKASDISCLSTPTPYPLYDFHHPTSFYRSHEKRKQ